MGTFTVILSQADVYNHSTAFIESPPDDLTVYQIAPEEELKTKTTTQNHGVLMNDYNLGLKHGEQFLNRFGLCEV